MNMSDDQHQHITDLQGLLSNSIQAIVAKLPAETLNLVVQPAQLMRLLMAIQYGQRGTVHDMGLFAIAAVAQTWGEAFVPHMQELTPILLFGINNVQHAEACTSSIHVVGMICRCIGIHIAPYCDAIMEALLRALGNPEADNEVATAVLSCFADIGHAVGDNLGRYIEPMQTALAGYIKMAIGNGSDEHIQDDEVILLRNAILDAHTGVIQGLEEKAGIFLPLMEPLMALLSHTVSIANTLDDSEIRKVMGLLGDVGSKLGSNREVAAVITSNAFYPIIEAACTSEDVTTRKTAQWAQNVLLSLSAQYGQ